MTAASEPVTSVPPEIQIYMQLNPNPRDYPFFYLLSLSFRLFFFISHYHFSFPNKVVSINYWICLEMTTIHPKLPNLAGAPGHLGPSRAVKWKRAQAHWNSPPDTQKWKYCNQHPIICTCVISGKNKRQKKNSPKIVLLMVTPQFPLSLEWIPAPPSLFFNQPLGLPWLH